MPYIRFTRDQRGYEHTCIVHAARRRGRKDARVLYWFRTPPNVKVGRAPIDEEAIRAIERHNPDLAFDWPRIFDARPTLPASINAHGAPPPRARARRLGSASLPSNGPPQRGCRVGGPGASREPRALAGAPVEADAVDERRSQPLVSEPAPSSEPEPAFEPEPLFKPEVLAEAEAESLSEPEPLPESARPVPAEELVGTEGLARLRALYAELQARITERATEPARTGELRREAERLNPDAWVTLDEARQALEQYEIVSETFRRALGRRRRSRRGGARRNRRREAGGTGDSAPSEAPDSEPADD